MHVLTAYGVCKGQRHAPAGNNAYAANYHVNKESMRHDKLERELYLLQLLTENRTYTIERLCEKLGISRRNLYYYLEFFRDSGFKVYKHGNCYSIDRNSPFFNRLIERISITEEEAVMIRRLLDKAGQGDVLADNLRKKLERFYDFDIINNDELREQKVYNIGVLYDAIKLQRQVVIHGYASPHSRTTKDRLVEPFLLMNNNNEVRCYEPSSKLNKTFKVSRMQEVELLDTEWAYKDRHQQMYTDVFMFSGEKMMPVSMLLGQLSYNVFREEYPAAEANMTTCSDGRHRLDLPVCSYAGIGRFVLGLFDDIEVLGDEGFIAYLQQKVAAMASSYTHKEQ